MKRKSKLGAVGVDRKRARLGAIKPHQKNLESSGESMFDSLPLDLKVAILTRLPAKSLKQLQCVSKMWCSIIRSPEFVRSFSSISSTRPRFIVVLSNGIDNSRKEKLFFLFSFSPEDQVGDELVADFDMAIPSLAFSESHGYCTSLHGVLVVGADLGTRICDPSTDQLLNLPLTTSYVGYDPIADQYKAFSVYAARPSKNHHISAAHTVITIGQNGGWRDLKPAPIKSHLHNDSGISINGFIYYGACSPGSRSEQPCDPGIVCFDVRSEKLTYIKAPWHLVYHTHMSPLIEYKGKLAHIARRNYVRFQLFELWVLEDIEKHEWSNRVCVVPPSLWDSVDGFHMAFPGINKAGEIIMAPKKLPTNGLPYYIFYYNVETQNIRRVRLRGIGDNQEFMRSYGFVDKGPCEVRIAPQHIESIAFFNNSITLPEL